MVHLSSLKAVNYRGINGLLLPCLSRANLVTGVNGVGKTTVLEAIWLFTGRYNPSLLWNPNILRSAKMVMDPVSRLSKGDLEISGTLYDSTERMTLKTVFEKISDVPPPVFTGGESGERILQLPIVGRIQTYFRR